MSRAAPHPTKLEFALPSALQRRLSPTEFATSQRQVELHLRYAAMLSNLDDGVGTSHGKPNDLCAWPLVRKVDRWHLSCICNTKLPSACARPSLLRTCRRADECATVQQQCPSALPRNRDSVVCVSVLKPKAPRAVRKW